jgi:hypothetical protein
MKSNLIDLRIGSEELNDCFGFVHNPGFFLSVQNIFVSIWVGTAHRRKIRLTYEKGKERKKEKKQKKGRKKNRWKEKEK